MADKKSLSDKEISKVSGGVGYSNFQRNPGAKVNINTNDPRCPYDNESLHFEFQVGFANQQVFTCPKCGIVYLKDWICSPSYDPEWFIDGGTDS